MNFDLLFNLYNINLKKIMIIYILYFEKCLCFQDSMLSDNESETDSELD